MYTLSNIDSSTIARTMNAALVLLLASCAAPPIGPVPPSVELPQLAVGRSWTYQVRDGFNHGLIRTLRYTVASNSDDTVTLRDRDSTEQVRFKIAALPAELTERIGWHR